MKKSMKRVLAAIGAVLWIFLTTALTEPDSGFFRGIIGGQELDLMANMIYSVTEEGTICLDFFTYHDDGIWTDVYIGLPMGIQAGDILTQNSPDIHFLAVAIDAIDALMEYSSDAGPGSAQYTITIESADRIDGKLCFSGSVEATLPLEEGTGSADNMTIAQGRFRIQVDEDFPGNTEPAPDLEDYPWNTEPVPDFEEYPWNTEPVPDFPAFPDESGLFTTI